MTKTAPRLLFCALDYAPSGAGGAEHQARLQAESLTRRGYRVDVVCPRMRGFRSGFVGGVRVHRLPYIDRRPFRRVSYLTLLAAFLLLRLRDYDLVHVHLANLQADVAVAIARLFRRPSYLKLASGGPIGEIGRLSRVAPLTRYYGIRHATVVQAISDQIADELRQLGIPESRLARIPNGVIVPSDARTARDRPAARAALDLDDAAPIVLYAGRLASYKGIGDLLELWETSKVPPDAQLLLVGEIARDRPAAVSSLPSKVERRPWTRDVAPYLAAADVFVLPSYSEGMSNALLEAMAAGLACVATTVGATPEVVEDGRTGLLVPPGDVGALGRALSRLLADATLREAIGAAGRASVANRYGIESVVDSIEVAYRGAIGVL